MFRGVTADEGFDLWLFIFHLLLVNLLYIWMWYSNAFFINYQISQHWKTPEVSLFHCNFSHWIYWRLKQLYWHFWWVFFSSKFELEHSQGMDRKIQFHTVKFGHILKINAKIIATIFIDSSVCSSVIYINNVAYIKEFFISLIKIVETGE